MRSLDMLLQSCSRLAKKEKKGFAWVCHAVVVVTPLQEPQSLVLLVELLQLALLGHNQCVCLQTPLFFVFYWYNVEVNKLNTKKTQPSLDNCRRGKWLCSLLWKQVVCQPDGELEPCACRAQAILPA